MKNKHTNGYCKLPMMDYLTVERERRLLNIHVNHFMLLVGQTHLIFDDNPVQLISRSQILLMHINKEKRKH